MDVSFLSVIYNMSMYICIRVLSTVGTGVLICCIIVRFVILNKKNESHLYHPGFYNRLNVFSYVVYIDEKTNSLLLLSLLCAMHWGLVQNVQSFSPFFLCFIFSN